MRKIQYDFNSYSNRLLQADFRDYTDVLGKFISFINGTPVILDYISDCGQCDLNLEEEVIKNNVNQDEKEFRLLFYDEELFRLWLPMIGEPVDDNIDFSSKDSELKAYYKLPINITESDGFYIQDVLLGPLCKATTNDVQVFLRRYGFNSCNISRQSWVVMR